MNPAVLHTATESLGGFAGDGILKTVDGGGSWGFATSGLPRESEIIRIAVDRSDPSTLYASARGIFKTRDGGETGVGLEQQPHRRPASTGTAAKASGSFTLSG